MALSWFDCTCQNGHIKYYLFETAPPSCLEAWNSQLVLQLLTVEVCASNRFWSNESSESSSAPQGEWTEIPDKHTTEIHSLLTETMTNRCRDRTILLTPGSFKHIADLHSPGSCPSECDRNSCSVTDCAVQSFSTHQWPFCSRGNSSRSTRRCLSLEVSSQANLL